MGAGHHPLDGVIPNLQLLLHPPFDRISGNNATQNVVGCRQTRPIAFGQGFYVFEELHTMGQHAGALAGLLVQGPLEPCIANVQGQECHVSMISNWPARKWTNRAAIMTIQF
jgi:hypothetical protein